MFCLDLDNCWVEGLSGAGPIRIVDNLAGLMVSYLQGSQSRAQSVFLEFDHHEQARVALDLLLRSPPQRLGRFQVNWAKSDRREAR